MVDKHHEFILVHSALLWERRDNMVFPGLFSTQQLYSEIQILLNVFN